MSYVTDMRHYEGTLAPGAKLPAPLRRMVEFLGRLVGAASVEPDGRLVHTDIGCLKGTGRRACQGEVSLFVEHDRINWACPVCGTDGVISNWRGSIWDMQSGVRSVN